MNKILKLSIYSINEISINKIKLKSLDNLELIIHYSLAFAKAKLYFINNKHKVVYQYS